MAFRVEEYVREDGSIPFKAWFDQLDHQAAAKVATAVARVIAGNTSSIKWFRGIGGASGRSESTGDQAIASI